MPQVKEQIDALRIYHTGAVADALPQVDAAACLGGYKASTEASAIAFNVRVGSNSMPAVVIEKVFGACGEGEASFSADTVTALKFTPPGGGIGTGVTLAANDRMLFTGSTASKAIRAYRDSVYSSKTFRNLLIMDLTKPFNNAIGGSDVTNTQRAAGVSHYTGFILSNDSTAAITTLRLRVKPLIASATVSGVGQLGAAGSGTITTAGSFATWPTSGYARIVESGGTLREIVYYTSRTSTALTVPAAGRGLLGTSAGAGAATDDCYAVPGIRIGIELPVSGAIQTIASATTAPTGATWDSDITLADGPTVASLAAGETYGLWIHRQIPAGATAHAKVENSIEYDFVWGGVTYTESAYGLYRIEDTTLPAYLLHIGEDADPDTTAAADDSGALPLNFTVTPPGVGTKQHRIITLKQNSYGLKSLNNYLRYISVDTGGALYGENPSEPYDIQVLNVGAGYINVRASYSTFADGSYAADTWAIYTRGDGVNPDPATDTPVTETMADALFSLGPIKALNKQMGPYPEGMEIRVLVRAKKTSTTRYSQNTTPTNVTVDSLNDASAWQPGIGFGRTNKFGFAGAAVLTDTVINVANNIFVRQRNGATELWNDTQLVWRLRYDSRNPERNGFWTTFARIADTISGAAVGTGPIEYVDANTLYVLVNNVRRMKIDLLASELTFASRYVSPDSVYQIHNDDPHYDATWATLFQVYDQGINNHVTAMHLDTAGKLTMKVGWKTRSTEAEL